MRPFTNTLFLLLFVPLIVQAEVSPSSVGTKIESFNLRDFRGKQHSLADIKSDLIVVAFMGTECPLAKRYAPRLQKMQDEFAKNSVTVLSVNSNRHDSITELAAYARTHDLKIPVLKDVGNKVADQFGATRTPEVFVLDKQRVIRYQGRIDDQYGVGYIRDTAAKKDLAAAINDLIANRKVKTPSTEAVGCFIGKVRKPNNNSSVTYSNQVARVLQKHCVECHRVGEIAPFSLTSYEDVIGWGETMMEVIDDQRMPPWHADPKHGKFENARLMTSRDKEILRSWVKAGSPEGDRSQLPKPLAYTKGWQLPKTPDQIIDMRKTPYKVAAEGTVRYQHFRVNPGFTEDKWIKAAELMPGNRAVVHHILVAVAPPSARRREVSAVRGEFLAAYVPGYRPPVFPDGMAKLVPAGSELIFQLHYTPIGSPQEDLSQLGLIFEDGKNVKKVVVTQQAVTHRFEIPPNADNYEVKSASRRAPAEVELLAMMPHMHLRGKSFKFEVRYPDGKTEVLLDVPRYDFNWQTSYRLTTPKKLPTNSYIHCVAHFDNSEDNLNNPDPNARVRWGDQTWNEMMIGYFDVAIDVKAAGIDPMNSKKTAATPKRASTFEGRIIEAIKGFDKNKDGILELKEVPEKHHVIFKKLDLNSDSKVTNEEADAALRKFRSR
jgi:peroxiredoxin